MPPDALLSLRAAQRYYRLARRYRTLRRLGAVGFAAAAPVITFWVPSIGPTVGAVSGAWLLAGRTYLEYEERVQARRAAAAQELYDTHEFDLGWNTTLVGPRPALEDLEEAAARETTAGLEHWYPNTTGLPRTVAALLCQRASAVWGRRLHQRYAAVVAVAAFAWLIGGFVMGAAANLSLTHYLVLIFLPSQPAFFEAVDVWRLHRGVAARRQRLEHRITDHWDEMLAGETISGHAIRLIQDELFRVRAAGSRVPEWLYRLHRADDEHAMRSAADKLRLEALGSLGSSGE